MLIRVISKLAKALPYPLTLIAGVAEGLRLKRELLPSTEQ